MLITVYRITSGPFDVDTIKSSLELEDPELKVFTPSLIQATLYYNNALQALLTSSTKKAKKKKKVYHLLNINTLCIKQCKGPIRSNIVNI